jgi:hypothetical protein
VAAGWIERGYERVAWVKGRFSLLGRDSADIYILSPTNHIISCCF